MKRIPLIIVTPTIKVQTLCFLASQKVFLISHLHNPFKKLTHIFISQQYAENSKGQILAIEEL
jgi:hypothetical protein